MRAPSAESVAQALPRGAAVAARLAAGQMRDDLCLPFWAASCQLQDWTANTLQQHAALRCARPICKAHARPFRPGGWPPEEASDERGLHPVLATKMATVTPTVHVASQRRTLQG